MTIKEFYQICSGDYNDVFSRLRSDERILKYLKMFLMDDTYLKLKESVALNDVNAIFSTSHNLKGMSANLGLTSLTEAASAICEETRHGNPSKPLFPMMEKITEVYEKIASSLKEIQA